MPQPAAYLRDLRLDFLRLPLIANQRRFKSRAIKLQCCHELDYKFRISRKLVCNLSHVTFRT